MSRLGKIPVAVPKDVKVNPAKASFSVTGPKGTLTFPLHRALSIEVKATSAVVGRSDDSRESKTHHGLTRSMLENMVMGVSKGYERRLEISGTGWGAKLDGKDVVLTVGFCNPARIPIPPDVKVECPSPTSILVKGIDRQKVGQLAAKIRKVRPPEPYNAKGVKYSDEVIKKKQGKSFGTT